MKTRLLSLALALLVGGLLSTTAWAQDAPEAAVAGGAATVTASDASPELNTLGAEADVTASCQTADAAPLFDEGLGQSGCFGPNPPFSCKCGSCCSYCKCWQGYYLALCDFE